jgi:CHAD domain-containing protein
MNANQTTQSNMAKLPPAQVGVGDLLQPEAASPSAAFKLFQLPAPAFPATQPSQLSGRRVDFSRRSLAVGPFLAEALGNRWQTYRAGIRRCQDDFSEQSVHKLRVATRRLIAQLLIVGCVTPGRKPRLARRVLKRRLKALGELRDTHVQRLYIQCRMERFPELVLVEDVLRRRERRLQEAAARKVKGFKTRKLAKWILNLQLQLAMTPSTEGRPDRLPKAVARATGTAFATLVNRRKAIDPGNPETIHRTRIAFKKFRYMVESLSPDFTGLGKCQLRALAHYQQRMGTLQDLEIMERCIAGFARRDEGIGTLLAPFSRYLRSTRVRALRSFLKSADELFLFWPPALVGSTVTPRQRQDQSGIPSGTKGQCCIPEEPQDRVPDPQFAAEFRSAHNEAHKDQAHSLQ